MRCKALVSVVATLSASAALAAPPAGTPSARPVPPQVLYLYGFADLERLKKANPDHYARAERIIAAAGALCRPGPDQVYFARFEARDISCEGALLRTSNPPKREIGFTLDDIRYVALITVREPPPRPTPLGPTRAVLPAAPAR
jgi:hypothetical protein